MSTRLANNVRGTLTAPIASGATSMTVLLDTGSNSYPSTINSDNPMYLTISDPANFLLRECVRVTAVSGSNVTTMTRGVRGTAAVGWSAGAVISLNVYAEDLLSINDDGAVVNLRLIPGSAAANAVFFGTAGTGLHGDSTNVYIATAGSVRATINSTGLAIVGTYIQATSSGGSASLRLYTYRNSATLCYINFYAGRGSSGTPDCVDTGDIIAAINAAAYQSGTTFGGGGAIRFRATEDHSATANGTEIQFYTCPNTSTTVALALTIGQDKKITIPGSFAHTGSTWGIFNATPTTQVTVTGDISSYNKVHQKALLTALAAYGIIVDGTTT